MNFEKIINRTNEIITESENIKNNLSDENKKTANELVDELDRIVSRTYKDEDKNSILKNLHKTAMIWTGSPDEEMRDYKIKIENIQRTAKKIIKEYELFGFEDFTPIEEKVETEWEVGTKGFNIKKKKSR